MTLMFEADGATEALPRILTEILLRGETIGSRQGEQTVEITHPTIVLTQPLKREILLPERRASIVAQIAETMWVLRGDNEVEWLGYYLPRAAEFSDDGYRWRSGYGPRLRDFNSVDQIDAVVNTLNHDRSSRRAVISLWDPTVDSLPGKDTACNNWLHFLSRNGRLDLHVATRSNDVIWGWSGINTFEWSVLLEIVAHLTGNMVGRVIYSISSFHIYEKHWNRARDISQNPSFLEFAESPRFNLGCVRSLQNFDRFVEEWFHAEDLLRNQEEYDIDAFPEPMMRSWLRVIAWKWSGDESFLEPLKGTRLHAAVLMSNDFRQMKQKNPAEVPQDPKVGDKVTIYPVSTQSAFCTFADNLHREKDAVYGDSWKKRGEQISILANIARKVDRLGEAGAGDTAADTVIDLMVYLVKYALWMRDAFETPVPFSDYEGSHVEEVAHLLRALDNSPSVKKATLSPKDATDALKGWFAELEDVVSEDPSGIGGRRSRIVTYMLPVAYRLAKTLWDGENPDQRWLLNSGRDA